MDKAFCAETTVTQRRAQVLHCFVLQWSPVGRNDSCFYLPGTCGSHLSRSSLSLSVPGSRASPSVPAPLCQPAGQAARPTGLQRGSCQSRAPGEDGDLSAGAHQPKEARPGCCPLCSSSELLGEQQLRGAAIPASIPSPLRHLWAAFPPTGMTKSCQADRKAMCTEYPKLVTHNSWGQLPSFD